MAVQSSIFNQLDMPIQFSVQILKKRSQIILTIKRHNLIILWMLHGDSEVLTVTWKLCIFVGWRTTQYNRETKFQKSIINGSRTSMNMVINSFAQQLKAGKHYSYMALKEWERNMTCCNRDGRITEYFASTLPYNIWAEETPL